MDITQYIPNIEVDYTALESLSMSGLKFLIDHPISVIGGFIMIVMAIGLIVKGLLDYFEGSSQANTGKAIIGVITYSLVLCGLLVLDAGEIVLTNWIKSRW